MYVCENAERGIGGLVKLTRRELSALHGYLKLNHTRTEKRIQLTGFCCVKANFVKFNWIFFVFRFGWRIVNTDEIQFASQFSILAFAKLLMNSTVGGRERESDRGWEAAGVNGKRGYRDRLRMVSCEAYVEVRLRMSSKPFKPKIIIECVHAHTANQCGIFFALFSTLEQQKRTTGTQCDCFRRRGTAAGLKRTLDSELATRNNFSLSCCM